MRVLITGTDGYIGSVLAPLLIARGHDVTGLDTGYFTDADLNGAVNAGFRTVARDIRAITARDLQGYDAVIHLAGLSNDALGQLSRRLTYEINHHGTMRVATLAKAAGVTRFLYASSCSLYGKSDEAIVTETSRLDPQTDYAVSKLLDERELSDLAGDDFSPTYLRNATAYGASPRMRFDLVVNQLAGLAWTSGKIALVSDGTPWRPIVHVQDISGAFVAALEAPRDVVHNQAFNVGRTDENYQVRDIAAAVADVFPGCTLAFGAIDPDQRSYRVSFDKIARALPGFRCEWDLRRGLVELRALFEQVDLDDQRFRFRAFTRLAQLRYLIESRQIDDDFFWTVGVR
jgi:nucleoside-diphosphate-sugar epimerase